MVDVAEFFINCQQLSEQISNAAKQRFNKNLDFEFTPNAVLLKATG